MSNINSVDDNELVLKFIKQVLDSHLRLYGLNKVKETFFLILKLSYLLNVTERNEIKYSLRDYNTDR
jgi:hypothetical protein